MYTRKIIFSLTLMPLAAVTNTAYEYQKRKKEEKLHESERRYSC